CLHDMGHAWQALVLAARAIGCESLAAGHFPDDEVAQVCRLNEDEWPMLIVGFHGRSIPAEGPHAGETVWFEGRANRLSNGYVAHPLIDGVHAPTKLDSEHGGIREAEPAPAGSGGIKLPMPASATRTFGDVVRTRRSALDFQGGTLSMSLAQLS